MVTLIRNRSNLPSLETEGKLLKPIDKNRGSLWQEGLTPFERMHVHHTLASVRRYAHFVPFPGLIPKNSLDLSLSSTYDHGKEHFPEKIDSLLQPETSGIRTWRRLQNTKDILPGIDPRIAQLLAAQKDAGKRTKDKHGVEETVNEEDKKIFARKYMDNHPVLIGGITERRHPSNVKLMNSSHHSPQTNAGYTRQPLDGNVFQY